MKYTGHAFAGTLDISFARTTFTEEQSWLGGLVWGHPGESLFVGTGVLSGPVRLEIRTLAAPPEQVEAGWEDVSEVSIWAESDVPVTIGGVEDYLVEGLLGEGVRLDAHGRGWYRLRVHARGRDLAPDARVGEPVEDYLVISWPGGQAGAVVHQVGSKRAGAVVEELGSGDSREAELPFSWTEPPAHLDSDGPRRYGFRPGND